MNKEKMITEPSPGHKWSNSEVDKMITRTDPMIVNTVGQTERHQVKPGESEASVYVFNHSKGNYIVSLVKDDTVLDSKQIIHE